MKEKHHFAKIMVLWCIVAATAFCIASFAMMATTGADASGILGVALAFFGGELLFLCLKRIWGDKNE